MAPSQSIAWRLAGQRPNLTVPTRLVVAGAQMALQVLPRADREAEPADGLLRALLAGPRADVEVVLRREADRSG